MLIFTLRRPQHLIGIAPSPCVTEEEMNDFRDQVGLSIINDEYPIVVSDIEVEVFPRWEDEQIDTMVKECAQEVFGGDTERVVWGPEGQIDESALKDFAMKFATRFLRVRVQRCRQRKGEDNGETD